MSNLRNFYNSGIVSAPALTWSIVSADTTAVANKGYILDNSSAVHTITLPAAPTAGDTVAVSDLNGSFGINNCTINSNSLNIQGTVQNLTLDVKNQRVVLVYSGATNGWIISELEPNNSQFEYMPYAVMHLQEAQAQNTEPSTQSAGNNTVVLNTLKQNDIAGASLASNQFILPAGTYQLDAAVIQWADTASGTSRLSLKDVGGTEYLSAIGFVYTAGTAESLILKGSFTLATPTTLYLNMWNEFVRTNGVSMKSNQGQEVYSNVVITKVGGNYAPRLITTDARLQMVSGLDYTGNILGFDVTRKDNTTLTVGKGACKDSTGLVDLYLTANTDVTLLTGASTISQIFVCKLVSNGNITVKAYASEAAAAADTGVISAFRWIDFWGNTSGGSIAKAGYTTKEGVKWYERFSENTINSTTATPSNITTAIDISSFVPVSRVMQVNIGAKGTGTTTIQVLAFSGVSGTAQAMSSVIGGQDDGSGGIYEFGGYRGKEGFFPLLSNNIYWGRGTAALDGTVQLAIHAVNLRR